MAKSKDNDGNMAAMEGEDAAPIGHHGNPMHSSHEYDNPVHDHHDAPPPPTEPGGDHTQPKDHSLPHAVQANVTPEPVPVSTPVVDQHAVSHPAPQMAAGSHYVLPKWRSHSEVYAAPIQGFDDQYIHVDGGDNPNVMQLVMVQRPKDIFKRGEPAFGDYLIMYQSGGMAWMPKAAFEATHERMPDNEV